jgi:hypothetical protein
VNLKTLVVSALAALAGCASAPPTPVAASSVVAPGPAQKDGWWIRMNTGKTEASAITLALGTDIANQKEWTTWRTGDAIEFDVPTAYGQMPTLYVRGIVTPQGKNGWFCVNYRNHGVKHMDFDNAESQKVTQEDQDSACADFVH